MTYNTCRLRGVVERMVCGVSVTNELVMEILIVHMGGPV